MRLKGTLVVGVATAALLLSGCSGGNDTVVASSAVGGELPEHVSLNQYGGWVLERNPPVAGGSLRVGLWAPSKPSIRQVRPRRPRW